MWECRRRPAAAANFLAVVRVQAADVCVLAMPDTGRRRPGPRRAVRPRTSSSGPHTPTDRSRERSRARLNLLTRARSPHPGKATATTTATLRSSALRSLATRRHARQARRDDVPPRHRRPPRAAAPNCAPPRPATLRVRRSHKVVTDAVAALASPRATAPSTPSAPPSATAALATLKSRWRTPPPQATTDASLPRARRRAARRVRRDAVDERGGARIAAEASAPRRAASPSPPPRSLLDEPRSMRGARCTEAVTVPAAVLDVAPPQFAMPRDAATPPSGCAAATTRADLPCSKRSFA